MKQIRFLSIAAVAAMAAAVPAWAQDVSQTGSAFLDTLEGLITGQFGLFIGLGIVILGLWTVIVEKKVGAGLVMIIGGVLITVSPGVFNGVQDVVTSAVSGISGGSMYNREVRPLQ